MDAVVVLVLVGRRHADAVGITHWRLKIEIRTILV